MRVVRFSNRDAEVPETYDESFDMLVQTMNAYQDRRGGNLERLSCAARVAYGLFGERFMAPTLPSRWPISFKNFADEKERGSMRASATISTTP
jgi:hypothetical protein